VPGSLAEKAKDADPELIAPLGPESIVVSGGVVSTGPAAVNVHTTSEASALPAMSRTALSRTS
jgi:hypothetical protein